MIGKTRYLYMYEERTHMHNLMWNAARIDDILLRHPETHIPAGILKGDDWIRAAQAAHHVLVLAQPTAKAARKKARQIARKRAKLDKKLRRDGTTLVTFLANEPSNAWQEDMTENQLGELQHEPEHPSETIQGESESDMDE